jgi:hypothetical protein
MTHEAETRTEDSAGSSLATRMFRTADGIGGWISIFVGLAAAAEGLRVGLGTISRMGPGYVPTSIGLALIGLGVLLIVGAARNGGPLARVPIQLPTILVLLALAAFAVLLPMFGLVPATIVLMLIASLAVTGRIGIADVIYAVVTSFLAVLVFINGLGVVLPSFRWPF